jgi:hypothetical protein
MDAKVSARDDQRDRDNPGASFKRRCDRDRRRPHARQCPARVAQRRANAIHPFMWLRRRLPGCGGLTRHAKGGAVWPRQRMGRPGQPGKENLQQHGVEAKDKKSGPPPWQSFAARSRHGPDNSFRQPRVKQANWRMAGLRVQHGRRCVHARAIHRGQLMIERVGAHAMSRRKRASGAHAPAGLEWKRFCLRT